MAKIGVTSEQITKISQEIEDSFRDRKGNDELLESVYREMDQIVLNSVEDGLKVFFLIVYALENCFQVVLRKNKDSEKLFEMAENSLNYCNITPVTSQHSHLYSRLHLNIARFRLAEGNTWTSITETMLSEYLSRDSKVSWETSILLRAEQAWRLGHLRTAKIALHTYDMQSESSGETRFEAACLLIRIYRLSGELDHAQALSFSKQTEPIPGSLSSSVIDLEKIYCQLVRGQDPKDLADYLNLKRTAMSDASFDMGRLWLCASRYRDIWKSVAKGKARKTRTQKARTARDNFIFNILDTLEEMYNPDLPLQVRLKALGAQLEHVHKGPDPEAGQLFLAAAIRWLYRSKHTNFASILMDHYQVLSYKYSEGSKSDTLGLLDELMESLPVIVNKESVRQNSQLYTRTLPRFLKISQIAAKGAYLFAKVRIKKLGPTEFRQQKILVYQQIIKDFEKAFGDFKGPAMKIGQLLAVSCFVNEDMQNIMQRINDNAEPVSFEFMRKPVEKLLPNYFLDSFSSFNTTAFAVASIGQVFKASLHSGEQVAVKIKYPEVEKIIAADMQIARFFLPLFRYFFTADNAEIVIEQFKIRFEKECDYLLEAESQSLVAKLFEGHPDIKVPKVYHELSNSMVLVSEFVDALRLDHFVELASLEERNKIAGSLLKFLLKTMFEAKIVNMDPHFGNFLVKGQDLVVLDFGAMMAITDLEIEQFKTIALATYYGDFAGALEVYKTLGLGGKEVQSVDNFKRGIGYHFFFPFHQDRIQVQYEGDMGNALEYFARHDHMVTMKADISRFFVHTLFGMYKDIWSRLQARLNWNELLGEVLIELGLIDKAKSTQERGA